MNPIAIYPYKEDPEIRKMRVQAWFRAVSLASGLTPRELEKKFSESGSDRKVKPSCVWDKYRRGAVVPRSGLRPDGELNLVDRVEAAYPKTAKWLTLPLWRLLDKAPMEMSEIRRCYESLPRPMRAMFIHQDTTESSVFWRRRELDCKMECELLLRYSDPIGFEALLILRKEAEITQNRHLYDICSEVILVYIRRLATHLVLGDIFRKLDFVTIKATKPACGSRGL